MANPLLHVTDYKKALSANIDRMNRQLAEHTQRLEQQSQQQYEAETAVTPVKVLSQLASTVNQVGSAAQTLDDLSAKKVSQDLKGLNLSDDEILTFQNDKKALGDEYNAFNQLLKGLREKGNHKAADYLKKLHGRKLYHAKSVLAGRISAMLPSMWETQLNAQPEDGSANIINQEYLELNDDNAKLAYKRKWAAKQFGDEFLNKGLLFENAADNINTWLTSDDILKKSAAKRIIAAQNEIDKAKVLENGCLNTDIETCTKTLQEDFLETVSDIKGAVIVQTEDGVLVDGTLVQNITYQDVSNKSEAEQNKYFNAIARELTTQRYENLAKKNLLSDNLLARITAVEIEYGGGKSLANIFTKEQWARIEKAADIGSTRAANAQIANRANVLAARSQNLQIDFLAGKITSEQYDNEVKNLELLGLDEATIRLLKGVGNSTTSESSYNRAREEMEPHIETGLYFVDEDDINDINNQKARNEFQAKKTRIMKLAEHPEVNFKQFSTGFIPGLMKANSNLVFNDVTGTYEGNGGFIRTELEQEAARLLNLADESGLKGLDARIFISEGLKKHWDDHDGGKVANDKILGKYAHDPSGRYKNYEARLKDVASNIKVARTQATGDSIKTWGAEFNKSLTENKVKTGKELLDIPESILTAEDLIGIIENGYFSSELKIKSMLAQESSYNVFERQLQALLNSDDPKHQELVAQYDLANYQIHPAVQTFYKQLVDSDPGKRLETMNLLRKDPSSLTYNQLLRLTMLTNPESQLTSKETTAMVNQINKNKPSSQEPENENITVTPDQGETEVVPSERENLTQREAQKIDISNHPIFDNWADSGLDKKSYLIERVKLALSNALNGDASDIDPELLKWALPFFEQFNIQNTET